MAPPQEWIVHAATVQVQYERGVVFLDKAGSLMLALEDALGKPFVGNVPAMTGAELRSGPERLLVTFGSEQFTATQNWTDAVGRLEQVSSNAWEKLSDVLGVARHVKRFGARYQFMFPTRTKEEAESAVARCAVSQPTTPLRDLVGETAVRAIQYVTESPHGRLRLAIDSVEVSTNGAVAHDLVALIPEHALHLDLDHFRVDDQDLSKGKLKDFLRHAWQQSRTIATLIAGQIRAHS